MKSTPEEDYRALQRLLAQAESFLTWPAERLLAVHADISGWSIGHHLHHLAMANGSVPRLIERLKSGVLGDEDGVTHPESLRILQAGVIPRGRKSPDFTTPPADLTVELITRDFGRMTKAVGRIEPLLNDLHIITRRFPHIYFGPLSAVEWLRFIHVHTMHHMDIVEIIRSGMDRN